MSVCTTGSTERRNLSVRISVFSLHRTISKYAHIVQAFITQVVDDIDSQMDSTTLFQIIVCHIRRRNRTLATTHYQNTIRQNLQANESCRCLAKARNDRSTLIYNLANSDVELHCEWIVHTRQFQTCSCYNRLKWQIQQRTFHKTESVNSIFAHKSLNCWVNNLSQIVLWLVLQHQFAGIKLKVIASCIRTIELSCVSVQQQICCTTRRKVHCIA